MVDDDGGRQPARHRFADQLTPNGHRCDEAASSVQKSIRRGLEDDALYFASELDLAGYGQYVWRRLRICTVEDCGLGEPHLAATIHALHEFWKQERTKKTGQERIFTVMAVCLLARSPKSYLVSNAYIATYHGERPRREVPDWARDKHTQAGRQLGRGAQHFIEVGSRLVGELELDDPYEARARKAMLETEARRQRRRPEPEQQLFDT
jgi:replication-associated recombination protein RarA